MTLSHTPAQEAAPTQQGDVATNLEWRHTMTCALSSRGEQLINDVYAAGGDHVQYGEETDSCAEALIAMKQYVRELECESERLRGFLFEISQGCGAYSLDPLTHASNCIDSMKCLAADALAGKPLPEDSDHGVF